MPKSIQEIYGSEPQEPDVGFFESALAGVATGIWNIPKGFVSLGAELYDLIGDTDKAKEVEQWFDDVNPFDDEAEARTIGKVVQAITQIAPVAIGGGALGIRAGKAIGEKLAKRAVLAKQLNKSFSLSKYGSKIIGSKSGAIIGGGIGEGFVADEDIGTFADMVRGTSLEPFAITMMDKDTSKEGREEAGRRLLNRIKFATEGALFNAAIFGLGKGVSTLQKPTGKHIRKSTGEILSESQIKDGSVPKNDIEFVETGLQEYGDGLQGLLQKYFLGLRKQTTGTLDTFQSQRNAAADTLIVDEVATKVTKRFNKDLQDTYKLVQDKYLVGENLTPQAKQEKFMERIQKAIEPDEGQASLLKFKRKQAVLGITKELNEEGKRLLKDVNSVKLPVDSVPFTESQFIKAVEDGKYPNIDLNKYTKEVFSPEKISPKAKFVKSDYQLTRELEDIKKLVEESAGKKGAAQPLINSILRVRRDIDNMSLTTLGLGLPDDLVKTIKQNIGGYFTTEYKIFNRFMPLRKYKVTGEQYNNAIKLFVEQQENFHRRKFNLKPTDKVPREVIQNAEQRAVKEVNSFLKTRSIDEVDVASKDFKNGAATVTEKPTPKDIEATAPQIKNKTPDNTVKKEIEGIRVQTDALKEKILEPWQRELAGVIKDPSYTFYATVMKQANLNSTIKFLNEVNQMGSKPGVGKFVFTKDEIIREFGEGALNDPKRFKEYISPKVGGDLAELTPLDGKYLRAPIYDQVFNVTSNFLNRSDIGTAYKVGLLIPKAISQVAKTILSPITHIRNFISAGAFAGANGIFTPGYGNISALAPELLGGKGMFGQAYGTSFKGTFGGDVSAPYQLLRKRMQRVDVLSSSVVGRDIDAFVKQLFTDPVTADKKAYQELSGFANKSIGQLRGVYGKLQELYLKEDDFWKSLTWGVETSRYGNVVKELGINKDNYMKVLTAPEFGSKGFDDLAREVGMTPETLRDSSKYFRGLVKRQDVVSESFQGFLDEVGGSLVRDLVPNYNYIGRTGKALRLTPFGNFIAFPLEIMRTGNNIMAQSINEITSGIPQIRNIGLQRLFGFGTTILGVPKGLTEFYKAKNNVSEEELSALRKFVPEWSKNSTLLPVDRDENGYIKYVDFSYTNAYDALLRPFRSVVNRIGDTTQTKDSLAQALGEGITEGMVELLEPFASESIFTEALINSTIRGGRGKDGRRVWQEADDPFVKVQKGVFHLAESFQPGSYQQIKRVANTALGKTDPRYGESFELDDEIKGIFGFRPIQSNPEKGLIFMTTRFSKRYKNASNLFNAQLLRGGRVTPEKLLDTYAYSELRKFEEAKEMNQNILAARELGVPEFKIRRKVKRRGINTKTFNHLMRGVYTPDRPSNFFVKRMAEITRDLNEKEGTNTPNPYLQTLPTITDIINKNRNTDLISGKLNFPEIPQPQATQQESRITTPPLNTANINPDIISKQGQNVGLSLPPNFASLSTAQKLKTLNDLGININ